MSTSCISVANMVRRCSLCEFETERYNNIIKRSLNLWAKFKKKKKANSKKIKNFTTKLK